MEYVQILLINLQSYKMYIKFKPMQCFRLLSRCSAFILKPHTLYFLVGLATLTFPPPVGQPLVSAAVSVVRAAVGTSVPGGGSKQRSYSEKQPQSRR